MKDLLSYIVTSLVTNPDAVVIEEQVQDGNVDLLLTVDPADMGLIIGKGGQTIRSIRKLLTVRAIAEQVRINLQLSEPEGSKRETPAESEDKQSLPSDEGQQEADKAETSEVADSAEAEQTEEPKVEKEPETTPISS